MLTIRFPPILLTLLLFISFDVDIGIQQGVFCDYWAIYSKLSVKIVTKNPVEFDEKESAQGVSWISYSTEGAEWTCHKSWFRIPKCPHLSIPEPPSNQILLTYFYLSEQFQKIQFELGDPVVHIIWNSSSLLTDKNPKFRSLETAIMCLVCAYKFR